MKMMAPTPKRAPAKRPPSWSASAAPIPTMPINENNAPTSRPTPAYNTAATFATENALTRVITIEASWVIGRVNSSILRLRALPRAFAQGLRLGALPDPAGDGHAEHRQRHGAVTKDHVVESLDIEARPELALCITSELLDFEPADHVRRG